ncbi:hypothetical protein ACIQCR_04365 [Streptomyces sp. NPDC093249]|uniref:hypothetical protein n=1 Tax=unclassified Streptomyces TaxID=2593676 RepID=UPI00344D8C21
MRRGAVAAVLLALLPLAGCGIQESDVVESGGAATALVDPGPGGRAVLYFLGPDGKSMPVARDVGAPGATPDSPAGDGRGATERSAGEVDLSMNPGALRIGIDKLLAVLLAGPLPGEAEQGITTALPDGATGRLRVVQDPADAASPTASARRLLRIEAPFPVMELPGAAVRQLVCTTAYAEHPAGLVDIVLNGPDGALPVATCDGPAASRED